MKISQQICLLQDSTILASDEEEESQRATTQERRKHHLTLNSSTEVDFETANQTYVPCAEEHSSDSGDGCMKTALSRAKKTDIRNVSVTAVSSKYPLPLKRSGNDQMGNNKTSSSHMKRMWCWSRILLLCTTSCWVPTCLRVIKLGKENEITRVVNSEGVANCSEENVKKKYQDIKGNIKKEGLVSLCVLTIRTYD